MNPDIEAVEQSEKSMQQADMTIAVTALEQAIDAVKQGDKMKATYLMDLAKRAMDSLLGTPLPR